MTMEFKETSRSSDRILSSLHKRKGSYWEKERKRRALDLFHAASSRVPAYKNFLKQNGIRPSSIKTWEDFKEVPPVNKKNYLRRYPLEEMCWDGHMNRPFVFTATSGSTGEPVYFPRGRKLDWEYSVLAQFYLQNSSYGTKGPTLFIVCFGMGVWIGGLITYQAFEIAARQSNTPLSIITPGINKDEIFKILKQLAPNFSQVVMAGYPPFLKDIVDEAPSRGVDLKRLRTRLLFAAEPFTEKFRSYMAEGIGTQNEYRDTLNIYGTADIGAMAFETPTSILIRKLAMENKELFHEVFPSVHNKTPTLAQYNPYFMTFEDDDGEILLTGDNALPLIKYAVGDNGETLQFDRVVKMLSEHGIDLHKVAKKEGVDITELPLVYVYERNDFSTTLYGLQIYPEMIREALIQKPLNKHLTGKFTMITKFNSKQDQYLEMHLELKKGKTATKELKKVTLDKIMESLLEKSSEFGELSKYLGSRAKPKLVFWPAEDPKYFKSGVKQKWVIKE